MPGGAGPEPWPLWEAEPRLSAGRWRKEGGLPRPCVPRLSSACAPGGLSWFHPRPHPLRPALCQLRARASRGSCGPVGGLTCDHQGRDGAREKGQPETCTEDLRPGGLGRPQARGFSRCLPSGSRTTARVDRGTDGGRAQGQTADGRQEERRVGSASG